MPNYFERDGDYQAVGGGGYGYGGGFGGFGGIFALIILLVVLLWLLFRDGKDGRCNDGGYNMPYPYPYPPYPYGGNCSPLDCKIPMAVDMSNCEVDRDLWKVDADLLKCCCEEKEVTHCEGEKTRALIEQNYIQDLRDKLAAAASEKAALESKFFTEKKFDQLSAMICKENNDIDKQFCKTDALIAALACEIPKRPPIFCEGTTPNTHHIDCHDFRDRDFPRRRGCNDRFDCDCCC